MRLPVLAAALLTIVAAGPALAQDPVAAPTPAPAIEAEAEPDPLEAALAGEGEAFEARMEQMEVELKAALDDPALDAAGKTAATDAILDRYVPDFEAFATALEAVLKGEADKPENADKREEMLAAAAAGPAAIRALPGQIRTGLQAQITPPAPPAPTPAE